MVLCIQNSAFSTRIARLCGSQPSPVVLCIHNRDIKTRIISLNGSQTSPVIMCMQTNVISIRNTSLYRSQPSFVAFACKTAALGPELQFSMGPIPHLWLLHAKQRLLDQNSKSLWVPDITCRFVQKKNRVISGRITSLHGCQTSLVVLCMQNSVISTRNTSLHGSQTSPVALCKQNNVISV